MGAHSVLSWPNGTCPGGAGVPVTFRQFQRAVGDSDNETPSNRRAASGPNCSRALHIRPECDAIVLRSCMPITSTVGAPPRPSTVPQNRILARGADLVIAHARLEIGVSSSQLRAVRSRYSAASSRLYGRGTVV